MQIKPIKNHDLLRNRLIEYTKNCGREAGPMLSQKIIENNFEDRERVFVVTTEDDNIV